MIVTFQILMLLIFLIFTKGNKFVVFNGVYSDKLVNHVVNLIKNTKLTQFQNTINQIEIAVKDFYEKIPKFD